ncbi:MAG: phosphoenolpyruvate carboxykinase (ATP), partial [Methyloprofundus sp.]|nr:phosphoenolpyruvate carboxykinase (ATP) [Methyloprofundus sp.]
MTELSAKNLGLNHVAKVYRNLSYAELYEHELNNREGKVADSGCMMIDTGKFTGRSPKDKYFVKHAPSEENIAWGDVNKPVSEEIFEELYAEVIDYLSGKDIYVTDGYAGASEDTQASVRFITEFAWQSHFVKNMFLRPDADQLADFAPDFRIYNASNLTNKKWQEHGMNSDVFVIFNVEKNIAIIGGTWYGGEMKKGI